MSAENPQTLTSPAPVNTGPWPYSGKVLADQLVARGFVPPEVMAGAIATAAPDGRSLVETLVTLGAITESNLRDAMAQIYELESTDLGENSIHPDAVMAVTPEFARASFLVPLELHADKLVVAVADPTRSRELRQLESALKCHVELRLAVASVLGATVKSIYAPRLTIRLGDGPKSTLILPPGDTKIGRATTNAIVVPDPAVSTTHALIRETEAGYQLVDMGSRNGTFVNGERVVGSRLLANKDEIVVAHATIKYRTVTPPDYAAPKDPAAVEAKRKLELRAELIKSSGRIISQFIGAAALLVLGLMISGMFPTSCGKMHSSNGPSAQAVEK